MIAYFFVNSLLSTIQQGVQSCHCLQEINNNMISSDNAIAKMFSKWKFVDTNINIVSGGDNKSLIEIKSKICSINAPYPNGNFNESGDILNSMLTCVGVVIPAKVIIAEQDKIYYNGINTITRPVTLSNGKSHFFTE